MDKNALAIMEKRIERTVAALRKNNFDAHYVNSKEKLFEKLDELMGNGIKCAVGGSMTLFETGVMDYLRSGKFDFIDRYAENADLHKAFHDSLSCDVYLMSSNAITEEGELYNVDGNGNRVAALVYGPEKVIVIAGANKIVKDMDAAVERVRQYAAPMNAIRIKKDVPCAKTGTCMLCSSPAKFCCHKAVTSYQLMKDRIAVLILPDSYGY